MFGDEPTVDVRRLLSLIDYLPMDSATSGAILGAEPGWSSSDELTLALLNQLILTRRMWAEEESGKQLEPVRMPWHQAHAPRHASPSEVRAFFGGSARSVER